MAYPRFCRIAKANGEGGLTLGKWLGSRGERGRNRTFNLLIKSQLLCQLSYAPDSVGLPQNTIYRADLAQRKPIFGLRSAGRAQLR